MEACSPHHQVFRCSDTRFTILVSGEPGETITERARRTAWDLSRKLSNTEWLQDYPKWTLKLPVCVGVVSFPKDASNKDQLLQILEETMSLVRRSGRGGVADADQGILRLDDEM
jgi:GGDEF domain-containing protein